MTEIKDPIGGGVHVNKNEGTLVSEDMPKQSFGQQLVGISFNPSGSLRVNRAKELCAKLADLVHDDTTIRSGNPMYNLLRDHTIGEILNAQMNVVKLLTLRS